MEEIEKSVADLKRIADSLGSEISWKERRKIELNESIDRIQPAEEELKDCEAQITARKQELGKLREKREQVKGEIEKGESRLLQQAEKGVREKARIDMIKKKQEQIESTSKNKIQISETEAEEKIKEKEKESTASLETILYTLSEELDDKKGELYRTDTSLELSKSKMTELKDSIKTLETQKKELTEDIFSLMDEKEEFNKLK